MYAIRSYYGTGLRGAADVKHVAQVLRDAYDAADPKQVMKSVITSYSIHYTKLYDVASFIQAANAFRAEGATLV